MREHHAELGSISDNECISTVGVCNYLLTIASANLRVF